MNHVKWRISHTLDIPEWFFKQIKDITKKDSVNYLARLLWNRGIKDVAGLKDLLDLNGYQSPSAFEFGQEIKRGISRLEKAWKHKENIVIWGDSRIDGVVATAILIEGLKPFFQGNNLLNYYFSEDSVRGLNCQGIDLLIQRKVNLIVAVDMGCESLEVVSYAQGQGIDIIMIDHHILPVDRPDVISFLNPLNFAENHPFYDLTAVGISYKLLEALYQKFSGQSPDNLLDLVALGLLANRGVLKGESRFLVQRGIKLIRQKYRPYIKLLSDNCEANDDRVTHYQKGLGIRIKVFNSIYNKENLLLKLLITDDLSYRSRLAVKVEQSYLVFLDLQQKFLKQIKEKIVNIDLSTNGVIIFSDSQWDYKFLALTVNYISQEYGHPTILFSIDENLIAHGFAYCHQGINLWELLSNQQDLLLTLTKYHQDIELSLPAENINLFRDNLNQQLRSKINPYLLTENIDIDLIVTVENLSKNLFEELELIEPCSLNNPSPKLLIQNCWFTNISHKNIKSKNNSYIQYIKTYFTIHDNSCDRGFLGVWEGHYSKEINPESRYDVIVELDKNIHKRKYFIRIIDLKIAQENLTVYTNFNNLPTIIDYRSNTNQFDTIDNDEVLLKECPLQWQEISNKSKEAIDYDKDLILAYNHDNSLKIEELWQKLIILINNKIKENKTITIEELLGVLSINKNTLKIILNSLEKIGINYHSIDNQIKFIQNQTTFTSENYLKTKDIFQEIIYQENLQKTYFHQVPISTIQEEIINLN
ncbi:DHH family phosphoesterase [Geminocystis sp. NIES-3709]|uniref:DHH family phosphoesterase n=1 Tax=Geminocystis sp. NIES-3709 TaxID=1617448 RepID=UPI0005FCBE6D|nr:DHH family phosphoesterase [Geminocystis sp. NIES-3709]BAQ66322.1 single-stranded-DNA-specific exonuclease RecJ [Geminocystis sp. NIES-3709]